MPWELATPPLRLRTGSMLESTNVEQLREVPYIVRGRDPELRNLLGSVAQPPAVLRLILGPPRSGKTSLLNYLEKWAEQGEMDVIRIRGGAFSSDTSLAAAIHPESSKRRSGKRGGGIGFNVGVAGAHFGGGIETITDPESDILRAVEAATHRGLRGVLVTIDELDTMLDTQNPDVNRRVRLLVQFMHRTVVEPQSGDRLLPAVLVATGSLTAIEDLRKADITGIEGRQTVRLGPVGPKAAARIVEDHWEFGKPLSVAELPRPPADWLKDAIEGCDGFVRHVQDLGLEAARQAVRVVERGGQDFEVEDLRQLEMVLADSRAGLYDNRWESAGCERHGSTAVAATVLAMASQVWSNRIPNKAVLGLTRALFADFAKDQRETERRQVMWALQRAGIIEYRKFNRRFASVMNRATAQAHWTVPVPSLAAHILTDLGEGLDAELDMGSREAQQWLRPDADTRREHEVPPWEWWDLDCDEYP